MNIDRTITSAIKIERDFNYPPELQSESDYQPGYINPFQCKYCHKVFTRNGNLKRHEIIHYGEKTFECAYCDYKFFRKEHLVIHERKHTGEKPYACDLCSHAFSRRDHLKAHLLTHKAFVCRKCRATFTNRIELKTHAKTCWDMCLIKSEEESN